MVLTTAFQLLMFREALVDHEGQEENTNAKRNDVWFAMMWADVSPPQLKQHCLKDEAVDRSFFLTAPFVIISLFPVFYTL